MVNIDYIGESNKEKELFVSPELSRDQSFMENFTGQESGKPIW